MSSGWTTHAVRIGALGISLAQVLASGASASEGDSKRFRTSWKATSADLELAASDGKVEISLDQAVAAALDRNLGLRVQRFQRTRALFTEYQNLGIYDYVLSANGNYRDASSPAASGHGARKRPSGRWWAGRLIGAFRNVEGRWLRVTR